MELIKVLVKVDEGQRDALLASFFANGCDGLEETADGALVYFTDALMVKPALANLHEQFEFEHEVAVLPETNWNAVWEAAYEPVLIDDFVHIRAPFHPAKAGFEYELLIEPKMSFGTGHHQTTSMVIKHMRNFDFRSSKVLDVGCGTGVLAILAHKLGALHILAIDIDPWSVENAIENCSRNGADSIQVLLGTMQAVSSQFDIVLANINKNIILEDLNRYAQSLLPQGLLFTSGYFVNDKTEIITQAATEGFELVDFLADGDWASLVFKKQ